VERQKICDLATGFYTTKAKFNKAFKHYEKMKGTFDFKVIDEFEKDLFHLKNNTHFAFRHNPEGSLDREHLFDLIIGSIFHESLHLKEYIYTLESYEPKYRLLEKQYLKRTDSYQDEFLKYSRGILKEAKENLPKKAIEVKSLFEDALSLLENMLKKYRTNKRLIRCLYMEREILNSTYGKNGLQNLYRFMYKGGAMEGFYRVGASFLKDGFYEPAAKAFEEAINADSGSANANELRQEIKKRCQLLQRKHPGMAEKILAEID